MQTAVYSTKNFERATLQQAADKYRPAFTYIPEALGQLPFIFRQVTHEALRYIADTTCHNIGYWFKGTGSPYRL